jgi:hypothetical protein
MSRRRDAGVADPWPDHGRFRRAATPQEDFDGRTAVAGRLAIGAGAAAAQGGEHALDMLAGAQGVDAMVDAAAGIFETVEAANLHLVEGATARANAETAEERALAALRVDVDDLRPPAPAPQGDLLLVGRAPSLRRRPLKHSAGSFSRGARLGWRGCGLLPPLRGCNCWHGVIQGLREMASRRRSLATNDVRNGPSSCGSPNQRKNLAL